MGIILRMDIPESLMFSAYKRYIKSYYRHCEKIRASSETLNEQCNEIKLTSEILDKHIEELGKYFKDRDCEKSEFFVSFLTFYGIHIENMYGEKTEHERTI